ncbi:MAG: hypothetical protein K9I71_05875 [Ignavibacteriales bacterium]|nr:hypothetical protein [Ignavibacteriales bacterium]MCF8315632.1 hypothetical protein [Ignavibacteriales bacterium]MCF8437174.1 hypothetical protein [Ignavibacteriales bacterium]
MLHKDYREPACSRQGRNDAKGGVINLDLQGQAGAEPGSDAKGRLTLTFRSGGTEPETTPWASALIVSAKRLPQTCLQQTGTQ